MMMMIMMMMSGDDVLTIIINTNISFITVVTSMDTSWLLLNKRRKLLKTLLTSVSQGRGRRARPGQRRLPPPPGAQRTYLALQIRLNKDINIY